MSQLDKKFELSVIYEDEDFLVLNKPENLLSQPTKDSARPDLYTLAKTNWSKLYLHHRLDFGTSGLILFTKTERYNSYVTHCFRDHKIQKFYLALVHWKKNLPQTFVVENQLLAVKPGKGLPTKMQAVTVGGQKAVTEFRFLQMCNLDSSQLSFDVCESAVSDLALIEAKPLTGRMHQIRCHCSLSEMPIFGDWLYGFGKSSKGNNSKEESDERLFLHAWKLLFPHPEKKEPLLLEVAPSFLC